MRRNAAFLQAGNDRPSRSAVGRLALCFLLIGGLSTPLAGQSPDASQQKVAEKFFEVLIKRPRPGTALDRVYDFHLQNHSLDRLLSELDKQGTDVDSGRSQMVLGLIQMRRGQYTKAVKAFQTAERLLVDDAIASFQLGVALVALGKPTEAAGALRRSIERGPSRREAPDVYLELGRLQAQFGKKEEAFETWGKLGEQFPGDRTIAERIAKLLVNEGEYAMALRHYTELSKRVSNPEYKTRYQIEAAELTRRLGRNDEANRQFQSLLGRLRPGSWLYRSVRDRLESGFLSSGALDELAAFYEDALSKSPNDLALLLRLGQILRLSSRLDEAQSKLEDAVRRAPDDPEIRIALIDVLVRREQHAKTEPHFEQLVRLDPKNPDHYFRWGQVVLSDSSVRPATRHDKATRIWNRLVATDKSDPVIHVRVANQFAAIDRTDEAIALYQKAIDLDPDAPQYREYLGEYLHQLNRKKEAIDAWRLMADGDRENRHSLVRLAEVLSAFEYFDRSLQVWRRAAVFDLSFDEKVRYADALIKSSAYDQAIIQLEQAEKLAESRDERKRVREKQIGVYRKSERLLEMAVRIGLQDATLDNRRFLAMLHLEIGDLDSASTATEDALSFNNADVETLIVAAEIAERGNRLRASIDIYERLVKLDPRYRTNHLRRLIVLHQERDDLPQAYETAKDLIAASPGVPDSYQIFSNFAFRLGREEEAVSALRSAIDYAPRDNISRLMLAQYLAAKYQTTEAIDLYWDAIRNDQDWSERRELVKTIAPLYLRRGETEQFLRRIETLSSRTVDHHHIQRLVATYWQTLGDHRRAGFILQQLQSQSPDDPELLRQLIDCLAAASDFETAVMYQSQLANLTGHSADIKRLSILRSKLGDAKQLELLAKEMELSRGPKQILEIIKQAAEHDRHAAAELCGVATRRNPNLWGVKCLRAQLLLIDPGDDAPASYREAIRIAKQVDQCDLKSDDQPPCSLTIKRSGSGDAREYQLKLSTNNRASSNKSAAAASMTITLPRENFTMLVGRMFGYADAPGVARRTSTARASQFLVPEDYYQAKWICRTVQVVSQCKLNKLQNQPKPIGDLIAELFPMPTPQETTDREQLKEMLELHFFRQSVSGISKASPADLLWRLAEIDPQGANTRWRNMLLSRANGKTQFGGKPADVPLDENQLAVLEQVVEAREQTLASAQFSPKLLESELTLSKCLIREFGLAGKSLPKISSRMLDAMPKGVMHTAALIQLALWTDDVDSADKLVSQLARTARFDPQTDLSTIIDGESQITWLSSPANALEHQFVRRHRLALVDMWISHCAKRKATADKSRATQLLVDQFGTGRITVPVKLARLASHGGHPLDLETPLCAGWMDDYLLKGLAKIAVHFHAPGASDASFPLSDECTAAIHANPRGSTETERKLRQLIYAYAAYWEQDPRECHRRLVELCGQSPADPDFPIEAARLAFDLQLTDQGIERLNQIDAPDQQSDLRIKLAKIQLFIGIKVRPPAAALAEEILQMDLDSQTRTQLNAYFVTANLPNQSQGINASLRRWTPRNTSQARRAAATLNQAMSGNPATTVPQPVLVSPSPFGPVSWNDDVSQLRSANELLISGNVITASEIAFAVLQKYLQNDGIQKGTVRKRAIDILRRADRLSPLIAALELKSNSNVVSKGLQQELTDLYLLSGQAKKATDLWARSIEAEGQSPKDIIATAESFSRQRENHRAAIYYLAAFDRAPELWKPNWTGFVEAAESSRNPSEIYRRLSGLDISSYSLFSLCNVIGIAGDRPFSESRRAFVRHVLDTHPDLPAKVSLLKRFVPDSERGHFPVFSE